MSDANYYLEPRSYDLIYGTFTADIPHAVALARDAGGPVLEVACGSGRVLAPMLEAGVECDGIDLSAPMIEAARAKLSARGLAAGLHVGDMRSFRLPRRYALVLIAFNSFLHNLTQPDQIATLRCCREHLAPGGRLALVVFHPSAGKLIEFSTGEHMTVERLVDGALLRVFDHADDDRIEQVRTVSRRVEHLDEDERVTREERYTFQLRYVFKPEMELLLRAAGYSRWTVKPLFANYQDPVSEAGDRPAREGDHLLWEAWA